MNFIITKWHEENPNGWVAVRPGGLTNDLRDPKHYKLIARAPTLKELTDLLPDREDIVFAKAWGVGIGKDYPIEK